MTKGEQSFNEWMRHLQADVEVGWQSLESGVFHDFWCQVGITALLGVITGIARGEVRADVVTYEQ